MDDLCVVICYRKSLPDKEENLNYILEYYKKLKTCEIIVVEQDIISNFNNCVDGIKHIFCYNNGLFNRSWAFNIGLNCTKKKNILFADVDCFIEYYHLEQAYSLLRAFDVVKPYNLFCMLNEETSCKIKKLEPTVVFEYENKVPTNYGAGMLFVNKTKILDVGSWPEEFEGWGGEDDAMSIKIKHKLSYTQTINDLFHLYHERNKNVSSNGHEKYEFNRRQALEIVPSMTKEQLDEYIEKGKRNNLGNVNKYKN